MSTVTYIQDVIRKENTAVTVGTFDGVHEGHKSLIRILVDRARKRNGRSVLVTFEPHPREIIHPNANIGLLTTLEERAQILGKLGLDEMVVIPFTRDFSLMDPEVFLRTMIYERIGISCFIIGYDHRFGRNREGSAETVETLSNKLHFDVKVVGAHEISEVTVSSTAVRKALIDQGDVELVGNFLGQPFQLSGTVVQGEKRGRTIGFPTANLKVDNPKKIIPKNGVYAVWVRLGEQRFMGMMNIGIRPTVAEGLERTLEVNLLDFDRTIYGSSLTVEFVERIRDERPFPSLDALKEQLKKDQQRTMNVLGAG